MCLGWMFFNAVLYGLLTWMPNYLSAVHGLDIKQLGGSLFAMFFSGFVGELVGGQIADRWRVRGGRPNVIFRTVFGVAAIVATLSIFSVAYVHDPLLVVLLLCIDPVLPALVRHVLGNPRHPRLPRALGLPRRLHESRRQHRRDHGAGHRRLHRAGDGIVFRRAHVLRLRGCRALRLLHRDRLQPQTARVSGRARMRERRLEMTKRIRLGMLTPSSNTVVETMTTAMLSEVAEVSAHFSRFKVTEIAVSDTSDRQFGEDEILHAAELLSHAKVDVIAWNGTSASWLGFDRDERLCQQIVASTNVAACTSVLAFREIFERTGVSRIGLVTPYIDAVQAKIVDNWGRVGISCPGERHCGLQDNFAFAEVSERDIAEMARAVARSGVEAIAIVCTNMRAAHLVESLEAELGVPVYNSIATTLWKSLVLTNVPPARIRGWGSLFSNPLLGSTQTGRPQDLKRQTDSRRSRTGAADPRANRLREPISPAGE